jgi:hypothetical protein
MTLKTDNAVRKPAVWRLALVYAVFIGIAGGVMALLGERPVWAVFAGVGLVFVIAMRKRARDAGATR